MHRRQFLQKGLLATAGGSLLAGISAAESRVVPNPAGQTSTPGPARIKLGTRLPPRLGEEALAFMRQLNLGWCRLDINPEDATESFLGRTIEQYTKGGIRTYAISCRFDRDEANTLQPEALNRKIAREQDFIRLLGRLGVINYEISFNRHTPYSQIYSTGTAVRRGIEVRRFDRAKLPEIEERSHRPVSAGEVIRAFDFYMERLLPVAEAAGVRIALHPDDPPIPAIGGVARVFHHVDHFKRVFQRHPSPNFGLLFCVGTWAEGGTAMGASVTEAIRHFAPQGKIFSVHFRNVSSPLPVFEETFMDDGYMDLQEVMDTLVDTGFEGLLVPDHIPHFNLETDHAVIGAAGHYESPFRPAGVAYSAAIMNAYLQSSLRKARRS